LSLVDVESEEEYKTVGFAWVGLVEGEVHVCSLG
jgi:hypothetical protein